MSIRHFRDSLKRNESAAIAPIFAIGLFALVGVAGVAFDYTRMMALHSELQNAADQAALAGASQLDGKAASATLPGACARSANAVRQFVTNGTRFAKDGTSSTITFQNEATCDAVGRIKFWQDRDASTPATNDANAHFVEVVVDPRSTTFALTPIVDAFGSGPMRAAAMAGVGSSICKQPPIMICHPDPGDEDSPNPFNADAREGQGVLATGHTTGATANAGGDPGTGSTPQTHWSPGNFGFLQIANTNNNAALLQALAYVTGPANCTALDDNRVSTGSPQGLYDAINTRFGIYDFPSTPGGGNVLGACEGTTTGANARPGLCPPANNVRMDFAKSGNACGIKRGVGGNGFELPASGTEYRPVKPASYSYSPTTSYNANTTTRMGMPRDLCHYTSFSGTGLCANATMTGTGRIGDGQWDRAAYWTANHPGVSTPSGYDTMTRYDVFKWENETPGMGVAPTCGTPVGDASRRVLTIAVVRNCKALRGGAVDVDIDEFVDVFLVEPSIDDSRRYNAFTDSIYFEIIGKSTIAGTGVFGTQEVRRDVPYLVR